MRWETASTCIFNKAGYGKWWWTELAQHYGHQGWKNWTYLAYKIVTVFLNDSLRCRRRPQVIYILIILTRWKHVTVSSCSRLYTNEKLPGSRTFPCNCTHKIPTVLFRTEPQSLAMYFTELFPSFLIHSTPLQTPHVQCFQTLTNNETLFLYNRTNEPIDRINYKNSYTCTLQKPRKALHIGLYFPFIYTNDCP